MSEYRDQMTRLSTNARNNSTSLMRKYLNTWQLTSTDLDRNAEGIPMKVMEIDPNLPAYVFDYTSDSTTKYKGSRVAVEFTKIVSRNLLINENVPRTQLGVVAESQWQELDQIENRVFCKTLNKVAQESDHGHVRKFGSVTLRTGIEEMLAKGLSTTAVIMPYSIYLSLLKEHKLVRLTDFTDEKAPEFIRKGIDLVPVPDKYLEGEEGSYFVHFLSSASTLGYLLMLQDRTSYLREVNGDGEVKHLESMLYEMVGGYIQPGGVVSVLVDTGVK